MITHQGADNRFHFPFRFPTTERTTMENIQAKALETLKAKADEYRRLRNAYRTARKAQRTAKIMRDASSCDTFGMLPINTVEHLRNASVQYQNLAEDAFYIAAYGVRPDHDRDVDLTVTTDEIMNIPDLV